MSEQAQALAQHFERANDEFINVVEQLSEEEWQARCPAEACSVGVTAYHVAGAQRFATSRVKMVAEGEPIPYVTMEMIDQANAGRAQQMANCTREEVLELARRNGTQAVSMIRELSDEQLARSAPIPWWDNKVMSVQQLLEEWMMPHGHEHLASIRSATSA